MTDTVVVVREPATTVTVVNEPPAVLAVASPAMGPMGPAGPPGGGASVHTQASPAATWSITHGLGRVPHAVTVYIGGEQVFTDCQVDATTVVLTFPSPMTGEAHVL
jgi:hypothetical protein